MKLRIKHWQDAASVVVGVWLVASPWVLGIDFRANLPACVTFIVIGATLAGLAVTELFVPEPWEEYSELYLAGWLLAAPWVQGFQASAVLRDNAVVCGVVVLVLAVWVLAVDDEFGWFHRRLGH